MTKKRGFFWVIHNYSVEFIFQQSCGCQNGKMYPNAEHKGELIEKGLQTLQGTLFEIIRHEQKKKMHQGLLCMKTKSNTLGLASS